MMISPSKTPLERVPQLWAADSKALNDLGIETLGDLARAIQEDGRKKLSDSSSIPPELLDQYIKVATAFIDRLNTRRRAAIISVLTLTTVIAMSSTMLFSQIGSKADRAYAELHKELSKKGNRKQLLHEVNTALDKFKEEPAASTVSLRLLRAALLDAIALDDLKRVTAVASVESFKEHGKRYLSSFDSAREELSGIDPNDPRIVFAHANSARAWTNRAEILGNIDTAESNEPEFLEIERLVREAQQEARSFTTLALNDTDIPLERVKRRVEDAVVELDNQTTRRMLKQTNYRISSMRRQLDELEEYIRSDEEGLPVVLRVQGNLTHQQKELKSQAESIIDEVGDAKKLTRDSADELKTNLDNRLDITDLALNSANSSLQRLDAMLTQHADDGSDPNGTNDADSGIDKAISTTSCGFTNQRAARKKLKLECYPFQGLKESLNFVANISGPRTGGNAEVRIEDGPTDHPLRCDIEDVMSGFRYTGGDHTCRLVFSAK